MEWTGGRVCASIKVESISPNPAQPRAVFSDASIDSLALSIAEHGLLSPILVRMTGAGRYELVAGERRLRAAKRLGMRRIDALIVPAYDLQSAVIALIENIQREQLSFLEEAEACRAILDARGMTQDSLARTLGRSPSALANRLRLLKLPGEVRACIEKSGLSERHARALLSLSDGGLQLSLAREAAEKHLTVRQLESRIARAGRPRKPAVKTIGRDMRLYVNAVKDTVRRIRDMGADADAKTEMDALSARIIIEIRLPGVTR